ncbi:MAG TPA: hypothetical protein VHO84_15050 [Syntrophorhabdaceae bacterium]|nr:hypothetical protein [Syntrophorhabdaceae bacterium]
MENITTDSIFFKDRKLKRLFIIYIIIALLFLGSIALGVVMKKHSDSLDETLIGLRRLRSNLFKLEQATNEMKDSVRVIHAVLLPDYFSVSSEKQLLTGLDSIKAMMKKDAVSVTQFAYTETEINLPVTITGVLDNYSSLVNDLGRLQRLKFPFFTVKSIGIKKGDTVQVKGSHSEMETKTATTYEINGNLRLPLTNGSGQEQKKTGTASGASGGTR